MIETHHCRLVTGPGCNPAPVISLNKVLSIAYRVAFQQLTVCQCKNRIYSKNVYFKDADMNIKPYKPYSRELLPYSIYLLAEQCKVFQ